MNNQIKGQENLIKDINRIIKIFKESKSEIRPHFFLTGGSGTGKSFTITTLAQQNECAFLAINAAQLTKEGTSGNSLSKALAPLGQIASKPTVVFVDEFDKLFISGNSNDSIAHENTTGVQNEFLTVLEGNTASVFGDYGKYININIKNTLFVFAGAFNGEENIDLDRLREMGVKTEFLGRVGLVYNTSPLSLDTLYAIVDESPLLAKYCDLFDQDKEKSSLLIKSYIRDYFDMNTLGARLINTIIHQYFITGKIPTKEEKKISFTKKLKFDE